MAKAYGFKRRDVRRLGRVARREERRSNRNPQKRDLHRGRRISVGVIPVQLVRDGGEDGDANAPASYTYALYRTTDDPQSDDALAEGVSPEFSRPVGSMTDGDGAIGTAYRDDEGEWKLLNPNEHPRTSLCPTSES